MNLSCVELEKGACKWEVIVYLFDAVNFHVRVRVHPAMPVAGHCRGPFFDGAMATVADETHHRDNHRQHRPGCSPNRSGGGR